MTTAIGLSNSFTTTGSSTAGVGSKFKLGSMATDKDGAKWMYVQATEAITQYMLVAVDESGQASKATSALALVSYALGAAQVAFAQYDFGWILVDPAQTNDKKLYALNACDSDVDLNTSATAGAVDDTYTTFVPLVGWMIATTTTTTAGATIVGNGRLKIGLRTSGV